MNNQPKPAPTAPREYVIPDEECLPKYFKEPAPTAEEQLPELEVCPEDLLHGYPVCDCDLECGDSSCTKKPTYGELVNKYSRVNQRERQLLAALRSNREKDAQLAELKQRCNTFMQGLEAEEKDCEALHIQLEAAEAQLAEKDAKIAELTVLSGKMLLTEGKAIERAEASAAQLRAVSEALKEKLEPLPRVMDTWSAGRVMAAEQVEEWRDDFVARLRSIVDGKD